MISQAIKTMDASKITKKQKIDDEEEEECARPSVSEDLSTSR